MNAYHWDSRVQKTNPLFRELQLHSTFGHTEAMATHAYFKSNNQRPFIIARSTLIGSGKFTSHWLGDNNSNWNDLQKSVPDVMNFNMFGIPFVGPDTCGFGGDTNYELC